MRDKKPQDLVDYERNVHEAKIPQFCHNCMNYSIDGRCLIFDMRPPEEFTQQQNDCKNWEMEPPF